MLGAFQPAAFVGKEQLGEKESRPEKGKQNMINAILFAVAFLWLIALSVQQSHVSHWFKTLQDERSRVLAFIDEAKASLSKDQLRSRSRDGPSADLKE